MNPDLTLPILPDWHEWENRPNYTCPVTLGNGRRCGQPLAEDFPRALCDRHADDARRLAMTLHPIAIDGAEFFVPLPSPPSPGGQPAPATPCVGAGEGP